jgi:hypothetical protein
MDPPWENKHVKRVNRRDCDSGKINNPLDRTFQTLTGNSFVFF